MFHLRFELRRQWIIKILRGLFCVHSKRLPETGEQVYEMQFMTFVEVKDFTPRCKGEISDIFLWNKSVTLLLMLYYLQHSGVIHCLCYWYIWWFAWKSLSTLSVIWWRLYESFKLSLEDSELLPYLPSHLFWRCARPCFHGNQNWFQLSHSLSSSPSSSSFLEGRWGHLLKNTASQPIRSEGGKQPVCVLTHLKVQ